MGAKTLKISTLPSRQVTGRAAARTPHRAGPSCADHKAVATAGRQNLENVKFKVDQKVAYLVSNPISTMSGAVGLRSSLAPGGAVAKVAEMTELPFSASTLAADGGMKYSHAVARHHDAVGALRNGCPWRKGGRPKSERGPAALTRPRDFDLCEADRCEVDRCEVDRCEAEVVRRREASPVNPQRAGVLRSHADQVEAARRGAVSHAGGRTKACL